MARTRRIYNQEPNLIWSDKPFHKICMGNCHHCKSMKQKDIQKEITRKKIEIRFLILAEV